MSRNHTTPTENFWKRVDQNGPTPKDIALGPCWVWKGSIIKGYGFIRMSNNVTRAAHRFSYELHHGPAGKLLVCHRCDNPICVNPNHLFLGSDLDNVRDALQKGRWLCGERKATKLNEKAVQDIRERAATGETHKRLSEEFGVSRGMVTQIVRYKVWKQI